VKGKLLDSEVKLLDKDKECYKHRSVPGGVVGSGGSGYQSNMRECSVYFANYSEFPYTSNIMQSLLIEKYQNIYSSLDYTLFADLQYVKYEKGGFFTKHSDVVRNDKGMDVFRALTMSVNLTNENDYTGGELVVYKDTKLPNGTHTYEEIDRLDREKGSFIIIPSFFVHEALKVESGCREAVVTWLHTTSRSLEAFKSAVIDK